MARRRRFEIAARSLGHGVARVAGLCALCGIGLATADAPAGADPGATVFTSQQVGVSGTTPAFSMTAPWTLNWQYNCEDYAQGGTFSLKVNQPAGDHSLDPGAHAAGAVGGGSVTHTDTGTFSLTVTSACSWWLQVYPTANPVPLLGPPEQASFPASPNPTRVGIAADPGGEGIWTAQADGVVKGFLGGVVDGDPARLALNAPIVTIAAARSTYGYYLLGSDGGVFDYGGGYYGSTGGMHLNSPVDGMAVTTDGKGYWVVASDGGVFSFGDAPFLGSMGSVHLNQPIVGMVAYGGGYTLVAADGGVFNFGTPFLGSLGSIHLDAPIVGMAATPGGDGYWLVARDGGVFSFGDAAFFGSGVGRDKSFAGIAASPDGSGYWLVASDGTILNFGRVAATG